MEDGAWRGTEQRSVLSTFNHIFLLFFDLMLRIDNFQTDKFSGKEQNNVFVVVV